MPPSALAGSSSRTAMAHAAHDLGVENLLVVPGAVHIPWRDDHEPVPNDVCDRRAREAVATLVKTAEKLKVSLNIENIFFNGYLMTPMEMNAFVDSFSSPAVRAHFDTGNIMLFQYPEHWIPILGNRIANTALQGVHQEGHRPLAGIVQAVARRHDQLACGHGCARRDRLSRLLHVRILPSVRALS